MQFIIEKQQDPNFKWLLGERYSDEELERLLRTAKLRYAELSASDSFIVEERGVALESSGLADFLQTIYKG